MGAASGLEYLHSHNIVHGDLKGVSGHICHKDRSNLGYKANVLIDSNHSARIADFGLTTIIDESTVGSTVGHDPRGTTRWMAPEMLYPGHFGFPGKLQKRLPSRSTDVYALAMTILEGCMPAAEWFSEY
jgi:serine/threonine protein kinase